MSFPALLILLSLIVVVPLFFVLKERSTRQQHDMAQRHREYLQQKANNQLQNSTLKPSDGQSSNTTTNLPVIHFSKNHPYVKLLHNPHVPKAF